MPSSSSKTPSKSIFLYHQYRSTLLYNNSTEGGEKNSSLFCLYLCLLARALLNERIGLTFFVRKCVLCVSIFNKIVSLSLSFFLTHQSIDDELFHQGGRSLTAGIVVRQISRIVHPLVLENRFRASSFRTRGARNTERKRRVSTR